MIVAFTEHRGNAVTLDFQSGLIQHVSSADDEGTEWSDNIVHELQAAISSPTGTFIVPKFSLVGFCVRITVTEDISL